ncbi:putative quinone oxidoreductase [Neofusicoccum parvum]|uniref:Quinone oxidoreductase n=1 Tax=Neofusicoccum parvum TaxID=310453 RepID=A0ACB5SBA6_9PEZI|nr:putative quinone oxidoreductase [Neofusicoccum parvum]
MTSNSTPQTHRTLKLTSTSQPPTVTTSPVPTAGPGSVVARVLAATVLPYTGAILSGERRYPLPLPLTPGAQAICRVVATGPDTTTLAPGSLILFDATIRARDDPSVIFASGMMEGATAAARTLSRGEWRDSTYAEFARLPLENCIPVDEARLRALGYAVEDLLHACAMLTPVGGLCDVGLRAGESVAIAPATGHFGGAAVHVALAMGARVVAMGRNEEVLARLRGLDETRVATVRISGDVEADAEALVEAAGGRLDVVLDISSPMAAGSTHFQSCVKALKFGGRISLMGGVADGMALSYGTILYQGLTVKGTWMCTREQAVGLVKMIEAGVLPLGEKRGLHLVGKFGLAEWEKAFQTAAEHASAGEAVALCPAL